MRTADAIPDGDATSESERPRRLKAISIELNEHALVEQARDRYVGNGARCDPVR
jgi:hypothetical protein